jgi:flagellar biogenesis protein FliO
VIFSYLLTLFGVCGLAVGSLVVLRAAKGGGLSLGAAQPIRVVGRQALGAGANLMLVEVDGKRMLIVVSRSGVSVLAGDEKIRSPEPVDGRLSTRTALRQAQDCGGSFQTTLKRAGNRW